MLTAGCASNPAPVPVAGSAADLSKLTGDWVGEYSSVVTGRSGSIVFRLSAGADTAYGDVIMLSRRARRAGTGDQAGVPAERTAQTLTVSFVRAQGGGVTGRLDPYLDPDCNCTVVTVFEGRFRGNSIAGTYTTSRDTGSPSPTGRWKVTRKKS